MENKHILFGICGFFCNHAAVLKQLTALCERNDVTAVINENVHTCSTRFSDKGVFLEKVKGATKHDIIHTAVEAERVGPTNAYNITMIAPMTAIVAAKMAYDIHSHLVTLSAKAMIRNQRDTVFSTATNNGLGTGRVSIFFLIDMKHFYIILFRQDALFPKERSIMSGQELVGQTIDQVLNGR